MQLLFEFVIANWDTIVGYAGSAGALYGWLSERRKRIQEELLNKRDSDVAFWKTTIEAQNGQIEKLRNQVEQMEEKYLQKIKELTEQVEELTEKLAEYEPERKRIKTTHTKKNA